MKREILAIALLCSSLILGGCGASNATSTNTDQSSKAATEEPKNKYEEDLENTTEIKSYWLTMDIPDSWDQQEDNDGQFMFYPSIGGVTSARRKPCRSLAATARAAPHPSTSR